MRPKTIRIRALLTLFIATFAITFAAQAQSGSANIAATDVFIAGSSLELEDVTATTGLNIPVSIQTKFGGLKNEQAPSVPELSAVGDLTGPGLDTPIQLSTAPGHAFTIPGLQQEGMYLLQNVRLMRGTTFVQAASPGSAAITVADVLKTKVSVRQLTAAELRARGIMIDSRNFDVYEYTLSFFVGTQEVLVPFPVIIDKRTHEVIPVNPEQKYALPGFKTAPSPPRWGPPKVEPMELVEPGALPDPPPPDDEGVAPPPRPSIPAAIVIPNSLGVLHEFFAVALTVTNNAPDGSSITLDSITATMKNPPELRVADTKPAVSFGRPVPLVDPNTGTTILIAQGKAEADWTLEGLKTGTHTFTIEVNATYKGSQTAEPIPLRGTITEQIVIHDPRFNITFSHPDTVRQGLTYSTFTFVTNMTSSTQTIRLRTGDELPACSVSGGADVCRLDDDISNVPLCSSNGTIDVCRPADDLKSEEVTLKPGATKTIVYKLRSNLTGNVFATAGTVDSDVIHAAVQLHMGVSTSGIPLSPATLVMPYYAQYLDQQFVTDNLQLLGLGYSLATAPVNQVTASFPRVITTDVFHRAVDISRAGQRIFIGEDKRDTLANLTLDLLGNGNGNKLIEWDQLRRREYSGRVAGASLARQIEAAALSTGSGFDTFLTRFGQTTAHRAPYMVAVTHGATINGNDRPYAISLKGATTHSLLDVPNELATELALGTRDVAFGDLMKLTSADKSQTGEMAAIGIWSENYELTVTPAAGSSFTLDLLYPSTTDKHIRHATISVSNASGKALKGVLDPANATVTLIEVDGSASYSANATEILPAPLAIIAAHQDMHLDADGHKVSVLFNRPVDTATDYKTKFGGKVVFDQGSIHYTGPRGVDAAALQDDERTLNLTFDHCLSKNATYSIQVQPITDPISNTPVSFTDVVPILENDRPAGIIYGRVLRGDNTPVPGAQVILTEGSVLQFDTSSATKADFLFEYVLRDVAAEISGAYTLAATDSDGKRTHVDGAIRLTGIAETVNLVYLGRGSAEGRVTYDNGDIVPNAKVVVGSTLFNQFRTTTTGTDGRYRVTDLPVGPLTFSATDGSGNTAFAASEVRSAGEIVTQDLSIYRQPFPGTGTIRVLVVRSDNHEPVANAHVGAYTQGYGLADGYTDANGRFEFDKVTTGLVTVLAEDWSIARKSVGEDFDLANDQVKDLTLTLEVIQNEPLANLEGDVEEEDPLNPGTYKKVPGALVQITDLQVVTADQTGHFTYSSLPLTTSGRDISAYNPASKRAAKLSQGVPTLDPQVTAYVRIPIRVADAFGSGTAQVRVLNAAGQPVSNLRVFEPGYPTTPFTPLGNGKYQLANVGVGRSIEVWAIATGDPTDELSSRFTYGDQYAHGSVSIQFNGQTALTVLRLPGQGKVRTRLLTDIVSIGDVNLTYRKWSDEDQGLRDTTVTKSTKDPATGQAGYAIFDKVPAGGFSVYAALANFGYDSASQVIAYDGQVLDIDLHAKKLASLSGVVFNIDGQTPLPGIQVKMTDGAQNQTSQTGLDGSFKFGNVAAGNGFTITAEAVINGIRRVGRTDGQAPPNGGPLNNLSITMKQQGSVEGFVVYSGYKVFDPNDPSKNVLDDTPNDLSDNARVPLAQFYLRELSYPYEGFGKESTPLTADIQGHFLINNVFAGPVRVTAWSLQNQDLRGDGQTTLVQEGSTATVYAAIGALGFGPVVVTVLDPNNHNAPVENAEVGLLAPPNASTFDFGTTDATGSIRFEQVPARSGYQIVAFSKTVGKSGSAGNITVQPVTGASAVVLLEFSGSVHGKLTDPDAASAPVPGVPVILSESTYQQEASTALDGAFFIGGVHEGTFVLNAMQESSRRTAQAQGAVSAADPNPEVNLELEHTSPLYVKVFYPNDDGSRSNTEVPTSDIEVKQRCRPVEGGGEICEYRRVLQGHGLVFTNLFQKSGYAVGATEIGGDGRTVGGGGTFPLGATDTNPFMLTLPAFGTVEVTVRQPGAGGVMIPAAGARVNLGGLSVTTDTSGLAIAHGIRLNVDFAVNAVSFDKAFSAYSPVVRLTSQSTPLKITIDLDSSAGVTGLVIAEAGGPSVGTRVVANWPGHSATVQTDATGSYKFQGIAVSVAGPTNVSLIYYGPDDRTIGFSQPATLTAADASQIKKLPDVTLDATPPMVVSIKPADNSVDVSPDTSIVVAFSEPLAAGTINTANFKLAPTDGSPEVSTSIMYAIDPATGLFTVTMTPPPSSDPAQRFPLKSNMLYRVTLMEGITDLQGHALDRRGFTFITADYVAPKVVHVEPATNVPLSAATTFNFTFNKPLASQLFDANHFIVSPLEVHLYKLSGPNGTPGAPLAGSAYGDIANQVVSFAPNDPLEEKSYYRLTLTGVRDTKGNVADPISYDYFSFDRTAPFITFDPLPVPPGSPIVADVHYVLKTALHDGSATGPLSTDVKQVDFFQVDGSTRTLVYSTTKAPFEYAFTGPRTGSTLTFHVEAMDTSLNPATPQDITFNLVPNLPPQNVKLTLNTPDPIYPNRTVSVTPSLDDEGALVTLQVQLTGTKSDGTPYAGTRIGGEARRATTADPWTFTPATYNLTLPSDLQDGSTATISITAADSLNPVVTGTPATFTVAADANPPVVSSISVAPAPPYHLNDKYTITAIVKDLETNVSDLTFTYDGNTKTMKPGDAGVTLLADGSYRFVSPQITVSAKNDDTLISIVAAARDFRANRGTAATEVTYVGVHDTSLPRGAWISPVANAAWPSDQTSFATTLRVFATDDQAVTGVTFVVPGITDPVPATTSGGGIYTASVQVATPAAGSDFAITAKISDADSSHTQSLTIPITLVKIDTTLGPNFTQAITSTTDPLANTNVLVKGPNAHLVMHVPFTFRNLIVVDGASVETLGTTTSSERGQLDLTVRDTLYVDSASSINVSGKGYLGGWASNPDSSGTRNDDAHGRTAGNTVTGGATTNASASHGGTGAEYGGTSNATYDSILAPHSLGAGGGGSSTCCTAGGTGGGAAAITGGSTSSDLGRIIVAGSIQANGLQGSAASGAGGSVRVNGHVVTLGYSARVTANGGDEAGASNAARGAGGGRISVVASEELDLDSTLPQLQAHGGRNLAGEGRPQLDGGAGTVFVRRPIQQFGELTISSLDENASATTHLTRPTILGYTRSGNSTSLTANTLTDSSRTFTSDSIGEELTLGGDNTKSYTITAVSADGHMLTTDSADGSLLDANGVSNGVVSYAGLLVFDAVRVSNRGLARFDDSVSIGGTVDDVTKASITTSGAMLLRTDVPVIMSFTTTPADGSQLIRGTTLNVNYNVSSAAGIGSATLAFSPVATPVVDTYADYVSPASKTNRPLAVATDAPLGAATLTLSLTDRAGRQFTSAPLHYTVVEDALPAITRFDVTPSSLQTLAGKTITVDAAATDDVAMSAVNLTASAGTLTAQTPVVSTDGRTITRSFSVAVPPATKGGTKIDLTLAASDNVAAHAATTQTKSVTIITDPNPPSISVTSPVANTTYQVSSNVTIPVRAVIVDAEVAVDPATVLVSIGGGTPVQMTPDASTPNGWKADLPVPSVDGTQAVQMSVVVTAKDYEGNPATAPAITINIQPVFDPNGPIVAWLCPSVGSGAMYPSGFTALLRVSAAGASSDNGITSVNFFINNSTTPVAATLTNGVYQASVQLPTGADGTQVPLRVEATSIRLNKTSISNTVTLVTAGSTISADTTISATDTSYDTPARTIVIDHATVTIAGHHDFGRLILLNGAKLQHAQTTATSIPRIDVHAASMYVSCDSSIDVTARGFAAVVNSVGYTYNDANSGTLTGGSSAGSNYATGGSHGGRGGQNTASSGTPAVTYGSAFDPNEPGGAGAYGGSCDPCNGGGGVVRLSGTTIGLDGNVLVNGTRTTNWGGGAGGSIRIDAATLTGIGKLQANGGDGGDSSGGGGRIALYYQTMTLPRAGITAYAGTNSPGTSRGAAGTIYFRTLDASGAKSNDEMLVDNGTTSVQASRPTDLPTLGSGNITAVSGATLTLSTPVPNYIDGTFIELLDGTGAMTAGYEILSHTSTTVTVKLASGQTITAPNPTPYRGTWRLDQFTVNNTGSASVDVLRTPSIVTSVNSAFLQINSLKADAVNLHGWARVINAADVPQLTVDAGRLEAVGVVTSTTLNVINGSTLTTSQTTPTSVTRLVVNANTLNLDASSSIDVSGKGFAAVVNSVAYTYKDANSGTLTGGSGTGGNYATGGSHGGRGGKNNSSTGTPAAPFGSLFDPNEPGGTGGYSGNCDPCNNGGGIARITAQTFTLNGNILANGQRTTNWGGGAGGSVRIDAATLTGAGTIHANGADGGDSSGGGGRVAIYYQTLGIDPLKVAASAGTNGGSDSRGAAGTVYFRKVNASSAKVSDQLVVDNGTSVQSIFATEMPAITSGTVTAVSGATLTLSQPVPDFVDGMYLELLDGTGAVTKSYEIISHTATTVTVRLASGESAAAATQNQAYRAVFQFDQVTVRNSGSVSFDSLRTPLLTGAGGAWAQVSSFVADSLTINGWLRASNVNVPQLTVDGGRLEVNGTVTGSTFNLINSATLTTAQTQPSSISRLNVNVSTMSVDATSSIDVSGKGFAKVVNSVAYTYKDANSGTLTNGSGTGSNYATGGSHGGRGGQNPSSSGTPAATFGSLFDPNEPGGTGGYSGNCDPCNNGGGIARITAQTFTLNGSILANGQRTTNWGGGAGGSVRIDATTLTGTGQIHANGADGGDSSGAGGRIAIYYQQLGIPQSSITAAGGTSQCPACTGSAGTIFLKSQAQSYGDLIVDNLGRTSTMVTTLTYLGVRNATAVSANSVTDATAAFTPDTFSGIRLVLKNDPSSSWPITGNTATTVTVTPDAAFTPHVNDQFRGLDRLDTMKLRSAIVETQDLVILTASSVDQDGTASHTFGNVAAPVIDPTKFSFTSSTAGPSLVGAANAVTDPDGPIILTITNTRTTTTWSTTINSGAPFTVAVGGNVGDTITVRAKDSHKWPLQSADVVVGTLPTGSPSVSQINRTDWTSDTNFVPRTLAVEGTLMAVASRVDGSTGASDKVAILDIGDPLHPALKRVISTGSSINAIQISNGFLFVANNRFSSFDLSDPNSPQNFAADQSGNDYSLVISGGYAFTGEQGWANDGRINVYDISNPAAPRFLSMQQPANMSNNAYNWLFAYGTDYLVGVNGWGGTARDVVVFNRRNVNALQKVGELTIANFNPFRGKLAGSKLYLVNDTLAEMVVVDLTNPAAPVVAGRITLPATGTPGLDVVANDVLVANKAAGLVVTTADPANLAITGSATTGGSAWDVVVQSGVAYVANETGVALVPVNTAPVIRTDRISLSLNGANVDVTGLPRAVTGGSPTVTIVDTATNATVLNLPVNADGSFTATLPASPGDPITLTATSGKTNGPVSLGQVPFAQTTTTLSIANPNNDANWRARLVRTEGNNLVVAGFPEFWNDNTGTSDKIVLYDISNPAAPVQKRVIPTVNRVLNMQIVNGWAYVVGERFGTVNLNDPNSTVNTVSNDPSGNEYCVAVAGNYAFTGEVDWANDGRINVYDITTPGSPRLIRQSPGGMTGSNTQYSDLIPYGTDYLVALSPGGANVDVFVIDRRNVNNLFKVGQLAIANITAYRGRIAGTKLYLGGWDQGSAIVDLSNPATPTLVTSVTNTPSSRALALSGSTLAVANAGSGVAFYDVSANTLRALGTQPVTGTAWDVAYGAGALYVAAENSLVVLPNVAAPPIVDTRLISVGASSSSLAAINGNAGAVTGRAPFTTELKDVNSNSSMSVTINNDGSFSASMPANPGDTFTLKVTDAASRVTGPVTLGTMPFAASLTTVPIVNPAGDTLWRARLVRNEGNNLVLASIPADGTNSEDTGNSNKIVLYDVSDPASPVFKRTVNTVNRVLNMRIQNGWAYVVGERFGTLNLNDPNSTINTVSSDPSGDEYSIAIAGNYAFTGEVDWANDGRINVYDITNPGSPRFIRQSPSGMTGSNTSYSDLIPYGTDYLVAISPYGANIDVFVIDRRNVNNLFKVGQLSVANVQAYRGRIAGTKLYLSGFAGGAAIVDLSNPASPTLVTSNTVALMSRGLDLTGSTLAVANGSEGVAFYNVASNALTPIGSQLVGGNAWDVSYGHGALYVAADTSLIVLPNVSAPAVIDTRLISVGASSATMASVTGSAGAVTGQLPLTTELKDTNSGASISVNVAADGSFTSSLPATPGDTLTLKVTDGNSRVTGPVVLGTMPFGTGTTTVQVINPSGDTLWRARMVRTEGNNLVLASIAADGTNNEDTGNSNKIVLFDISNPAAPVQKRVIPTVTRVLNAQIVNGWAYVTGDRFSTINLNDPNSTINTVSNDPSGDEYSIAIAGNYAFTGEVDWANDGRINVYDITDPSAPRFIRQSPSGMTGSNTSYSDLIPYGTDYLVAISPYGANIDVFVIDRRNVNNLFKVGQLSVAGVQAFRGRIAGTKLYLGGFAGGAAIVDLSNPATPTLVASNTVASMSRGLDLAGSTLAVANGTEGVAFYDVSSNTLNAAGLQPTGGVAWDCAFNGANLYVANDLGLVVIQNVVAPPRIDTRQISVMSDGTNAIVHGNATAISGLGSLTADVKDATTGALINVPVNSDGSFDATVAAAAGDVITVKAIDGSGRTTGPVVVGTVPFGSALLNVPVVKPGNDTLWRSRIVRTEGNNLVLASLPWDPINNEDTGNSNKIVLYDISNPASPQFKRTINTVNRVLNVQIQNGWAYVVGERFGTVNLNDPNSVFNTVSNDPSGNEYGLAVSGGYAFTGEVDWASDGRLNVYDVTDPGTPRLVRQTSSGLTGLSNSSFSDLIPYGTNYLIATSNGSAAVDIFILDRRDVWNIFKAGSLSIANMTSFRSKLVGTKLYVSGIDGGTAIVDVANPASPLLVTATTATPISRGAGDVAGTTLAVPYGSEGAGFYDVSNNTLRSLGTQPTGGVAYDVSFNGGNLYVANDLGLAVIRNVMTPPSVQRSMISVTSDGTLATITGGAHAIGGASTVTLTITDTATAASVNNVAVNTDGSFSTSITAKAGDPLTLVATDSASRTTTRPLGVVPFFAVTNEVRATRDDDAGMQARRIVSDGTNTVATTSTMFGFFAGSANSLMLLNGSATGTQFAGGVGTVNDLALRGNWAYFAGDRLTTVDLSATTLTRNQTATDPSGRDMSIALVGNYAVTGEGGNNDDARLNVYDITNPAAPVFLRQNTFSNSSTDYYALLPYNSQYLIGLTSDHPGVTGDIAVFDVSNIASTITRPKVFDIPNFSGIYGTLNGTWLYVVNHKSSGLPNLAIVDMSNPLSPVVTATISTPGQPRNVAISGPNEIVVADGGSTGLTFIDVTNKSAPVILGSQQVDGTAKDVKSVGKNLYIATETRVITVARP